MKVTKSDVMAFLVERYATVFHQRSLDVGKIPESFDIFQEGIVDSFGIMELLTAIEEEYGRPIDYETLPAEQLTRIGTLSEFVSGKLNE